MVAMLKWAQCFDSVKKNTIKKMYLKVEYLIFGHFEIITKEIIPTHFGASTTPIPPCLAIQLLIFPAMGTWITLEREGSSVIHELQPTLQHWQP